MDKVRKIAYNYPTNMDNKKSGNVQYIVRAIKSFRVELLATGQS